MAESAGDQRDNPTEKTLINNIAGNSLTSPLQRILCQLEGCRDSTNGHEGRCPAHDDRKASLSVGTGPDGRILLNCHAGCDLDDICGAFGIEKWELFVLAEYNYYDEASTLLFQVVRKVGKQFRQRRPDGEGDWIHNVKEVRQVLYRLPEVLKTAKAGGRVLVPEGEKDVESLVALGGCATTNPGGAGQWRDEFAEYLRGAEVVILPDHDEAGLKHAQEIAESLHGTGVACRIVELPGLTDKQDVTDWLKAGGTLDALSKLVDETVEWRPARRILASVASTDSVSSWPQPLAEAAFTGLAGEIVRAIAPETEADPAALLGNLLGMFGSAVGRGPHIRVGAERHHANLFFAQVGATSGGRKGTAIRPIRAAMKYADPEWEENRIVTGLSSGEGIVYHLRDGREPADQRLFVIEEEFVSIMRMLERTGNTLSPVLRAAWDSTDLQTLTKNSPLRARGAHVSIMAHVTESELRRTLKPGDMSNGFAPRFLWLAVKRSKLLPDGGSLPEAKLEELGQTLGQALKTASTFGEITKSDSAARLWHSQYERLTFYGDDPSGVVLSRGAPQVLRLALIYALLDGSRQVLFRHLKAALAFWKYAEDSSRMIFEVRRAKPVPAQQSDAERLLIELRRRPRGMTRTEISALFHRNKAKQEIDAIRISLGHRIGVQNLKTGKRLQERWIAV